jgi:hypothetical protein
VRFTSCAPAFSSNKVGREIGDLLLVYKHLRNGRLVGHRASIIQTKYTSGTSRSWSIDSGQYCLMNHWPPFKLVRPAKFSNVYVIKPRTRSWAIYGFIGPDAIEYPVYFSAQRILEVYPMPASAHFSFNLSRMPSIWVYSVGLLSLFFQSFLGENLLGNLGIKSFVDDLYKIAGLLPDPPGEFEWNDQRSDEIRSFGIIEFTVAEEKRIE